MLPKSMTSIGQTTVFTVLALVLGALGVIAVKLNKPPAPPPPAPKVYDVLVAAADLMPGRTIAKSDFFIQKMTSDQKKEAGFTETHFSAGKDLIGRIVRQQIGKGHYFTLDCLYPEGTGPSISEKLKPGMRAVVVTVDPASVTNLTTPDSFVDVLFHPNNSAASPKPGNLPMLVGGRILESIEVMALDMNWYSQTLPAAKPDSGYGARVTLSVTSEQAEMLKSLESLGKFSLVAVPTSSSTANEAIPTPGRMKEILGIGDPPLPEPPKPQIEIVRGGQVTKYPLDSTIGPLSDFMPYHPVPVTPTPIGDPRFMPMPYGVVPPVPAPDTMPVPPAPSPQSSGTSPLRTSGGSDTNHTSIQRTGRTVTVDARWGQQFGNAPFSWGAAPPSHFYASNSGVAGSSRGDIPMPLDSVPAMSSRLANHPMSEMEAAMAHARLRHSIEYGGADNWPQAQAALLRAYQKSNGQSVPATDNWNDGFAPPSQSFKQPRQRR